MLCLAGPFVCFKATPHFLKIGHQHCAPLLLQSKKQLCRTVSQTDLVIMLLLLMKTVFDDTDAYGQSWPGDD